MNRSLMILFLLSFIGRGLFAQDNEKNDSTALYRPAWGLKVVPLAFLAPTPSIQIAVERRTFKDQSIQLEYGHIENYFNYPDPIRGFKIRGEYRFYHLFNQNDEDHKQRKPNSFCGVHFLYKQFDVSGQVFVFDEQLGFQRRIDATVVNESRAIYFIVGNVFHVRKRFFMEYVIGLGARRNTIYIQDFPEGTTLASNIETSFLIDLTDGRDELKFMGALLSFKIGYRF